MFYSSKKICTISLLQWLMSVTPADFVLLSGICKSLSQWQEQCHEMSTKTRTIVSKAAGRFESLKIRWYRREKSRRLKRKTKTKKNP